MLCSHFVHHDCVGFSRYFGAQVESIDVSVDSRTGQMACVNRKVPWLGPRGRASQILLVVLMIFFQGALSAGEQNTAQQDGGSPRESPYRCNEKKAKISEINTSVSNNIPESLICISNFYWHYAILAADVYSTRGKSHERVARALSERERALLRAGEDSAEADLLGEVRKNHTRAYALHCPIFEPSLPETHNRVCEVLSAAVSDISQDVGDEGSELIDDSLPADICDCEPKISSSNRAPVPLSLLVRKNKSSGEAGPPGWVRDREIEKYAQTKNWRMFVPELAIEVWRRPYRGTFEYAIVFRGTAGKGGWFTNLRVVTGLIPIFWDQYQQARYAADKIISQVYIRHIMRLQAEYERSQQGLPAPAKIDSYKVEPYITAVGHSLGGGLARYAYLTNKAITRVVAFNPSPIDGSRSLIGLHERFDIEKGRRPDPGEYCGAGAAGSEGASIFQLYEKGEVMSKIAECESGRLWGAEGGPKIRCDQVNFVEGRKGMFQQHSMSPLACRLAFVHAHGSK
jgi:hypothetical protein